MDADGSVARIAAAIGEPARTRMLFSLMDGHARTSTELAMVAEVTPSTASVHLHRLKTENLINVMVQGRHRYYSLAGRNVAKMLEGLSVLAGERRDQFVPSTPNELRAARSCYDHMAGTAAVLMHDRFVEMRWIQAGRGDSYEVTNGGADGLLRLGIEVTAVQSMRRRFAYACLDWSERRPHLGGALGAALLTLAVKKKWVTRELDSRALLVTRLGKREILGRLGVEL